MNHLKGLLSAANDNGLKDVFVHAFTDGRDVDPKSGAGHLQTIQDHMDKTVGKIATVTGRYYAMDRDNRWERVKLAYDVIANNVGEQTADVIASVKGNYANDVTDEFVKPLVATENGTPIAKVEEGDVVIFFNFRTDRGRELTKFILCDHDKL